MNLSWDDIIKPEMQKEYYKNLMLFLNEKRQQGVTIYPPENEIFSWTQYCNVDDVKVIIIGQDPYPQENQAHGLAFSVKPGIRLPGSLRNIFEELEKDEEVYFRKPDLTHGRLVGWAKQGVLLLN